MRNCRVRWTTAIQFANNYWVITTLTHRVVESSTDILCDETRVPSRHGVAPLSNNRIPYRFQLNF
jgi:hypothetical protein